MVFRKVFLLWVRMLQLSEHQAAQISLYPIMISNNKVISKQLLVVTKPRAISFKQVKNEKHLVGGFTSSNIADN